MQNNNVVNKSLNFGGDITPYYAGYGIDEL